MSQTQPTPGGRVQRGISGNIFLLSLIIVGLLGYVAGTRSDQIMAAIGPSLGIKVVGEKLDLSSVNTTYAELSKNFDGALDRQKLVNGANRGLVAATNDPYTVYLDPKEADALQKDLSGDIGGGIGAEIGLRAGRPTIIRALPNNPAEAAGVKAGDTIVAVNGESAADWTADDTARKVRGEPGTTVKLTLRRGNETKQISVTRATVNNPSVRSEIRDGMGILTISRFDKDTATTARAAAENFKRQNVRGVVLDLRGNGGGYLDAAQALAGVWLRDKVVVTEKTGNKTTDTLKTSGTPLLENVPTVVLVNAGSASASEIVAGALQDYKVANLIGEKTFGKGTVQKIIDLAGGAQLKVTIARWYTPNGKNISKEGITPNRAVGLSQKDVDTGFDPQLEAALKQLKG